MENNYALLPIAKRFGFKFGESSIFGAINGQPVVIKRSQGYTSVSIVFALKPSVASKVSKELIKEFSSTVKRAGKVEVIEHTLVLENVYGLTVNSMAEKVESVLVWWTEKLGELENFAIGNSDDVILYNDIPGAKDEDYKRSLEAKLAQDLKERPVDNYSGLINGGLLSLLASAAIGIVMGVIESKLHYGVPLFGIMLAVIVVMGLYKKFSNGFDKKSWMYIVPLFLVCAAVTQITHIGTVLWFRGDVLSLERAVHVFLMQFKKMSSYGIIMLVVAVQFAFILFFLERKTATVKVEEGRFLDQLDEEWLELVKLGNSYVIKFFLSVMLMCLLSMFGYIAWILHDVSFTSYIGHIVTFVVMYVLSFCLFFGLYRKKIWFSAFQKHQRQKIWQFVLAHIFVQGVIGAMAFSWMCLVITANVCLDPWDKTSIDGTLLEKRVSSNDYCRNLEVKVPEEGTIVMSFCAEDGYKHDKGSTIPLIWGRGLFGTSYYRKYSKERLRGNN